MSLVLDLEALTLDEMVAPLEFEMADAREELSDPISDDEIEAMFFLGEEGLFEVESNLEALNDLEGFSIVGIHNIGCKCKADERGRQWDPRCIIDRRLSH